MGKLTQLKKKQNEDAIKIYPITVAEGVIFSDGNDLTEKTGSLTISKNGSNAQTFTELSGQNLSINLNIPTTVAELSDSGNYLTSHATRVLNATNSTATQVNPGAEITYVESLSGTNTATSGDLTVTATRKKITIPVNTDEHVTSVNNHYTPTGGTVISASGATAVSGATTQVISGIKVDAAGHITDIESSAVISGTNNSVSGSSLTNNNIILGNGNSTIKNSGKSIVTTITGSGNIPTDSAVKNYIDTNCQSTLTFDSTPTSGSTNPVTSDGIYTEFQNCLVADNVEEISVSSDTYYTKTQADSRFIRSESDPIFTNSVAYNIAASDISNWNAKTSNIGTITGITMNGSSVGTHGNVDLGTVITALPSTETWTFELENGTTVTKTIYIA